MDTPSHLRSAACALALALSVALPATGRAQAGGEDASYHPTQFNNSVRVIRFDPLQAGKVVVGGDFSVYYEPKPINAYTGVPGVARLNADGTPDKGFVTASALTPGSFGVQAVAVLGDSKVIVGGDFTTTDAAPHKNIARLNSDGSLDAAVNPNLGSGADGTVYAVALQPDGKVLVGGDFRNFNGSPAAGLVRLNADLTRDSSFVLDETQPVSYHATALIVQPDGRILFLAGINSPPLRLNAGGSLDASFNTKGVMAASGGGDLDSLGRALALQADGKVLAVATFTNSTGGGPPYTFSSSIVRLNADGSLDTSFDFSPKISASDPASVPNVQVILAQPDGSVVFGGVAASVSGSPRREVFRLQSGGLFDGSFDATPFGAALNGQTVFALALQGDGRLLVGSNLRLQLERLNDLSGASNGHPVFFAGETPLSNGVYFLQLPNGNPFGYYSYLSDPRYLFHQDLGYEFVFDANDGKGGVYLYDFKSQGFFYTSPAFPFPYLYDFTLNTVLYYYPDPGNPGRYNTNGTRFFFRFDTGQIFSK